MIALEHLHVINVIHQEGSFTKASDKLFKARSAVSYSVKQVENYYDIEIFTRDTYRPELTREGQILINKIQHLLHQASEFDLFARQLNSEVEAELRISISAIFPTEKVTGLLAHLKNAYPNTIIHLNIETASGERMLKDSLVDIGIYGALEQDASVHYRQIEQLQLPVYVSNKFPLAEQDKISSVQLAKFPQVVVTSSYKSSPDTGISKQGVQWYVSDNHTKKAIILSGLGWGRLASHDVEQEVKSGVLRTVESQKAMRIPVYVAKLKSKALGPVGMMVWDYFAQEQG